MAGVYAGLKVLDLSWGIAGPMAAMLLGDNGADVTKIEPLGGDPYRGQLGYKVWQRGKRSAELNLKNATDHQRFLALAGVADVLVESFAPDVTTRLGIDYETLSKLNPRLVYLSITGYGRDNELSDRPAYDALVQARSGLMFEQRGWPEGALNHITGRPDPFPDLDIPRSDCQGADRDGPLFTASHWPSLGAFFNGSLGVAAALRARERSGRGQWVETSLLQGCLAAASGVWLRAENIDNPGFDSWILNSKAPKGHFQAADGVWLHNWVPNPRFLLQASQGEHLDATPDLTVQNDPDRFGTGPEEILVMSHYQPIMAAAVARFPADEWMQASITAGMTMQPVRSVEAALADENFLKDGCVTETEDAELGVIRTVGNAFNMSVTPGTPGAAPVAAGANTDEVKAEADALIAAARQATTAAPEGDHAAPLQGIVVLDLGLAIAGPFGTQLLSDLGATVIKINGLYDLFWHRVHMAYIANRGKQSITLNLKDARAMKVLLELVKTADIVQHNMRYDAAERLHIDYESLKPINPRLIYCHTRGFERGARAKMPGNDQTGACLTGIQYEDGGMGRTGLHGEVGKPIWSLTSFGDTGNGFLSAAAICAAIYHRDRTGEGQFVDTSIVNAGLLNTSYAVARPDGTGFDRPRIDGAQLGYSAGHRIYQTQDGWLCFVLSRDAHWDGLFAVLRAPKLTLNERFADAVARKANDVELEEFIETRLRTRTAAQWFAELDAAGVPCEIVNAEFSRELHDNEAFKARRWVVSYPHPQVGRVDQIGLGVDLSDTPGVIQGRPLIVGENTQEILAGMGYAEDEIKTMEKQFAIGFPGMPRMPPRPAKKNGAPAKGMAGQLQKDAGQ